MNNQQKAKNFIKDISPVIRVRLMTTVVFLVLALGLSLLSQLNIPQAISGLLGFWIIEQMFSCFVMRKQKSVSGINRILTSQFIFDILILTAIIHFMGGIEWIGSIFYLFVIIYIVFYLPQTWGKVFLVGLAFVAYIILIFLEYKGIITHHSIIYDNNAYQNIYYIIATLSVTAGAFIFLTLVINIFASRLRQKTRKSEDIRADLEREVKSRTKELEIMTQNLEEKVKLRTKELEERVNELERFYRLAIGRELKIINLKKEIEKLRNNKKEKKT